MTATPEMDARLLQYLAAREADRQQAIERAQPELETALAAFIDRYRDDPGLPVLLARMLKECAVAAFVRGTMRAGGWNEQLPEDSAMFYQALETLRSMSDLYPAWRLFDGRDSEDEGADEEDPA